MFAVFCLHPFLPWDSTCVFWFPGRERLKKKSRRASSPEAPSKGASTGGACPFHDGDEAVHHLLDGMKSILSAKSVAKVSMKYLYPPQNLQFFAYPVPLLNPLPRMPDGRRTYYRDISDELHESLSVSSSAIRNFLSLQNIVYKPGYTCYSVRCKQCRPDCKDVKSEGANILINTTSGGFQCTTCAWSGKWQQFQKHVDAFTAANASAGEDLVKYVASG